MQEQITRVKVRRGAGASSIKEHGPSDWRSVACKRKPRAGEWIWIYCTPVEGRKDSWAHCEGPIFEVHERTLAEFGAIVPPGAKVYVCPHQVEID